MMENPRNQNFYDGKNFSVKIDIGRLNFHD